jgi:DNA-3-methyladenine glycosylase II
MRKAIQHLKTADPRLGAIIEAVGPYRIRYMEPTFHSLARSIVYQQLSGKVASVIFGRLTAAAGDPLSPNAVLALSDEQMRSAGLSKQKSSYLRDLAAHEPLIEFPSLTRLKDQAVIDRLITVKGVGVWTAHMFLIFGLRRKDVLPTGDLGIRAAMKKLYRLKELPTPTQMEQIAGSWRPYCSVASWYLWRSLELPEEEADPEREKWVGM